MIEATEFKDCFWGLNGFDELKKYMRMGNDFCKDLQSILTERAEHELTYSKGLNKTSQRLQKLSKDFHGGLSEAWLKVSIQFDVESEMHRTMASALQEEIIKPLKILCDNQNKCRKPVELKVEKVMKNLIDKKTEDYKYRSRCFQLVKDIEKYMYGLDEAQKGVGGKPPSNKDIQKLESQIVKTKENLEKSEAKYYKACAAVELARQDWQVETLRGCIQMQTIESDRICSLEQLIKKLSIQIGLLSKKQMRISEVYESIGVNVSEDIQLACKKYGTSTNNEQEIYLYDIYSENTKNMMNRERRIESLTKWSEMLNSDLNSQLKARDGLDKVKLFAKENPNFNTNNEADIIQKMQSVDLMQTLYEASLFKVQSALSDIWDTPREQFKYSNLINTTYDKQGVPSSILKVPPSLMINPFATEPSAPSPSQHSPTYPTLQNQTTPAIHVAPIISMPMPCHIYESNSSNSNSSSSSGVGSSSGVYAECSSASSISTSSVSPSSTVHPQASPPHNHQQNLIRSSYLLTTASHSNASTLPQMQMPCPAFNNFHMENHYNNSKQSLSDDDDDDWDDHEQVIVGTCVAQFDYKCMRNDELNLKQGDTIEIIEKRADGWWRGQLNNSIEMSDLHKKLLKDNPQFRGLPPRTPPVSSATSSSSYSRRAERNKRDYSVIPWTKYFDSTREIQLENGNKFRVYIKGDAGPVFFFLHGGGFSGLSWSLLSEQLEKRIKCQCYAVDIRGHGDTETNDDEDLSIDTMSNDIKQVVAKLWENVECPPIVLIGHSMGGALATHVAARNYIECLVALCVIDVVEGSALDALSSMQAFLQGRPKMFNSVEQAIEYSIRSGSIKNVESARVSIVGQLKSFNTAIDPTSGQASMPVNLGSQSGVVMRTELTEEDEEESEKVPRVPVFNLEDVMNKTEASTEIPTPNVNITEKFVWRIDLTKTEKYWKEWFKGLSLMFLGVSVPKLLLLAGVDRLDKDLTVGQMQGKFQMQVLPQCGHAVHEDSPDEVAEALATFVIRHKFTEPVDGGLYQSTPSFMSQLRMRP